MSKTTQVQRLTPTQLRANLYRTLDSVAHDGTTILIQRDGVELQLNRKPGPSYFKHLTKRNTLACSPDELIDHTWAEAWGTDL